MRDASCNSRPSKMRLRIKALFICLPLIVNTAIGLAASYAQAKSDKVAEAKRLADEAGRLFDQGKYDEAIPVVERWLAIVEKEFGPEHINVAIALNNLAELYQEKGNYAKAEPLLQRALAIREKVFGPNHANVAIDLNNLGALYYYKGNYAKADLFYGRALAIQEKALGPKHTDVATTLNNLAALYQDQGDYLKAESLFERALAIREKALGPEHADSAQTLNNLALLYREKGDFAKAEPLYQRALAIREKALGSKHPDVATTINNLAAIYYGKHDYAKAEQLYGRALAIQEKALGPEHPVLATTVNNLGELYRAKGDYAKAEPFYKRALAIYEKALGPEHLNVATSLNNLAALYDAQGATAKAVALRTRSTNISEHNIALNLATGSERQKFLYLATYERETNEVVSLNIRSAPNDPSALRLGLTTVLRRKGRALDAMAESVAALRRRLNPEQQALFDQLAAARAQLASLMLGGPGKKDYAQYRAEIKTLEEQIETLEDKVSRQRREFRAQSQPVTIDAIQAAIPADAMLVEFVSFYPYNAKQNRWEPSRYAAYVLGNRGQPALVDLGAASEINKAAGDLRAVLREGESKPLSHIEQEVKPRARALDQIIFQPVRKLLGDKRRLLVSPDGKLNLIPFAALVDEQGKYLIQSYSLTYLTTGRDLLRFETRMDNKQGAAIFANPDFGNYPKAGSGRKSEQDNARTVISFSQAYFQPLPGTAQEARALKAIFPDATVRAERQATKTAIKQLNAPSVLHIATHGFFLDDVVVSASEAKSRGLFVRADKPADTSPPEIHVEDPLLRSGLSFAGANLRRGGDDNGILTAKEASGLNLWGTKLVVLSACDTGVGEIKNGEGVYGLRRALVLAGSETQVMSLWPVSDEGTRDLMIEYYKALKSGQGRGEALRQVQLKMISSTNRKHPYYWASFIQSGEWANLDGKRLF